MDRWSGVLKIPVYPNSRSLYKVAASLCLSPTSKTLAVPSANVVFFNGDRIEGTGNPVIEKLSDLQNIAEILVSKFGNSINAWVVEASTFNGPFAVYKDFIPCVNRWGEPDSYSVSGFPASTSIVSLLSNCFEEAENLISGREKEPFPTISFCQPKTTILGFSKGGTVLNQLVTELAFSEAKSNEFQVENQIIPSSKESLLNSISEIHYVDVGLNTTGAYLTDRDVIKGISKRLSQGAGGVRFILHGTPRQWCDERRVLIRNEKDKLVQLLESEAQKSRGKLEVCERFYFGDRDPDLQMHFEIIETMDVK